MKTICSYILMLLPFFVNGQTNDEKIEKILNITGEVDNYLREFELKDAKLENKNKLKFINDSINVTVITKRLVRTYKSFYTEKEISTIYDFINSSAFNKFVTEKPKLDELQKESFQDFYNFIGQLKNSENTEKYNYVYTTRKNGFYETENYKQGEYDNSKLILAKNPILTNADIIAVKTGYSVIGTCSINIELTAKGTKIFSEITLKNINKPLAIVSNNYIISAPIITSQINGGKLEISGRFSMEEAEKIKNSFGK